MRSAQAGSITLRRINASVVANCTKPPDRGAPPRSGEYITWGRSTVAPRRPVEGPYRRRDGEVWSSPCRESTRRLRPCYQGLQCRQPPKLKAVPPGAGGK